MMVPCERESKVSSERCREEAARERGRTMNQHQTTLAGPPRPKGVLNVVTTDEATLWEGVEGQLGAAQEEEERVQPRVPGPPSPSRRRDRARDDAGGEQTYPMIENANEMVCRAGAAWSAQPRRAVPRGRATTTDTEVGELALELLLVAEAGEDGLIAGGLAGGIVDKARRGRAGRVAGGGGRLVVVRRRGRAGPHRREGGGWAAG